MFVEDIYYSEIVKNTNIDPIDLLHKIKNKVKSSSIEEIKEIVKKIEKR